MNKKIGFLSMAFASILLLAVCSSALVDYRSQSYKSFSNKPIVVNDGVLDVGERCVYDTQPWGYTIYGVGSRYSDGSVRCAIPGDSAAERLKKQLNKVKFIPIKTNTQPTTGAGTPPIDVEEPPVCTLGVRSRRYADEQSTVDPTIPTAPWRPTHFSVANWDLCLSETPDFVCTPWNFLETSPGEFDPGVQVRTCNFQ